MHELSIAKGILQVIEEELQKRKEKGKVKKVNLKVGQLSGVEPEALVFSFDALSRNTFCDKAVLDIEKMPLKCKCRDCGKKFFPTDAIFVCPKCESFHIDILSGEELRVDSFEIE